MQKISLTAALVATTLSTAAMAADWVKVGRGIDSDDYIDRESIRTMPNGNKRAWVLSVYFNPTKFGDTSVRALEEYDCREGRNRTLQAIYYRGGNVIARDETTTVWHYAPPETVMDANLNYVCFGKLPE